MVGLCALGREVHSKEITFFLAADSSTECNPFLKSLHKSKTGFYFVLHFSIHPHGSVFNLFRPIQDIGGVGYRK